MKKKYVAIQNSFEVVTRVYYFYSVGEAMLFKAEQERDGRNPSWTVARIDRRLPNALSRAFLWISRKLKELA